jgi:hypothetical protein
MSPLDDPRLASHLVRRSATGTPVQRAARSERLAEAVKLRVAAEAQERPWMGAPVLGLLDRLVPRRQLGATLGALVLIGALASIGLLSVGSHPAAPTARSDWHLTTNELVAVVAEAKATGANVGKTIVADAAVQWSYDLMNPLGACSICVAYVYTGSAAVPPIRVLGMPQDTACAGHSSSPPPTALGPPRCVATQRVPGPFALRIEAYGDVTYVGRATLIRDGAWAFDDFAGILRGIESTTPVVRTLYPVQAFLVLPDSAPSCAVPALDLRFGCGRPAWLIARSTGSHSSGVEGSPPNAIRVQDELAPADQDGASAAPDRTIYLLRPVAPMPTDCFLCGNIGTAEVVAQLDSIEIPDAPTSTASSSPGATAAPPTSPGPTGDVQILSEPQLEDLVGTAEAGARNAGRIVVVDAHIVPARQFCSGPPCASDYFILTSGIDGGIAVDVGGFEVSSIQETLALRITGERAVTLVAQVQPSRLAGLPMSLQEYRLEIVSQQLHQPDPAGIVPHAFVVGAWLDEFTGVRFCPAIQSEPPRALDFSCGGWSWLTTDAYEFTGAPVVPPPNGLLVQATAYSDFAIDQPTGDPTQAPPRHGYYLVTPEYSGATPCVDAHAECEVPDAASVLGRVDPIDPSVFGPTPAPTALSSHAEMTLGQFRLIFDMPKTTWTSNESITGTARLEYTGQGSIDVFGAAGSGGGPFGFDLTEIDGSRNLGTFWEDVCRQVAIASATPLSAVLSKGGAWNGDDPNASFYADFFADPLYRLPPGDWDLAAVAEFSQDGCGPTQYTLTATIRIHVVP